MNEPLISVIVPVYNLERYIPFCVDSILKQTYKNLEVLLVDDGSSDQSGGLCDGFARKDPRVRVFHEQNGGVSAARNKGLDRCTGEYVVFVDGDDILDPSSIAVLYGDLQRGAAIFGAHEFRGITSYDWEPAASVGPCEYISAHELLRRVLRGETERVGVCGGIFSRAAIAELRFEEGRGNNEDVYFLFRCLMAHRTGTVSQRDDALYGYYARPGSAARSSFSGKSLDTIYFSQKMVQEARAEAPELVADAEWRDLVVRLAVLKGILRSRKYRDEKRTFSAVKTELFAQYGDRGRDFYGRYALEMQMLRVGDWAYMACVELYELLKKLRLDRKEDV